MWLRTDDLWQVSNILYCYDCDYCRVSSNIGTVWCHRLCHVHGCVLFHDLYHVLGHYNFEIDYGAGTVVDIVEMVQAAGTAVAADTAELVVVESSFAGLIVASVAFVA